MAKGVLGNDPFLRGAPARPETAIEKPVEAKKPKAAPGKKAAGSEPKKGNRSTEQAPRRWPVAASSHAPARASIRGLMSGKPGLKAKAPVGKRDRAGKAPASKTKKTVLKPTGIPDAERERIAATFGAPLLEEPPERLRDWEPQPHADAPELIRILSGNHKDFVAHPNTPELKAVLGREATQHRDSPEAVALSAPVQTTRPVAHVNSPVAMPVVPATAHRNSPDAQPLTPATAHRNSPDAQPLTAATANQNSPDGKPVVPATAHPNSPDAQPLTPATAHRNSPEGKPVVPATAHRNSPDGQPLAPATAHRNSPDAIPLTRPTAHRDSPDAIPLTRPTAHRDSPQVVADLRADKAIPHPLSPEAVEVQPASPRRPLVVEIVEEAPPRTAMGGREVLESSTSSGPVVALGVAREIFSGGIARPLAGAARGLFAAAKTAIGLGGHTDLDVWGKDVSLARGLEPLSDFLYERYFRVVVEGADHVPSGGSLLIGNHSGALPLDGPMLYLALRRERADLAELRWLMEDQIFHAPFIGVLANRLGAVRANPENATRLLEEHRPVAVFPEGIHGVSKRFSERYQLKRFGRGGYVKLAVRNRAPIVPVAIVGAEESMPLLGRLPGGFLGLPYLPITVPPLPARWHIRFGPPIDLSDAPANAEEDLAWVARINDRTRQTVEGMLTSMLRARTSVF